MLFPQNQTESVISSVTNVSSREKKKERKKEKKYKNPEFPNGQYLVQN